jgi:glycerol-3-phosphate acyltransferase PlsY
MVVTSYLVGSIPTSIIASKLLRGIDIREHGSGNAGATNVFRVLGWRVGTVVLLVDIAKGLIPTILFYKIGLQGVEWPIINLKIVSGLSAVFGHIWTIFAGFKGGKGVGTGAGMLMGLTPIAVLIGLIIFILIVSITRYVSLGSILASISIPITVFLQYFQNRESSSVTLLILSLIIPILIIFTHRSNIQRLLGGKENRVKFKKNK